MKKLVAAFLRDECGADMIEYSLIAMLMGLVAIGALSSIGNAIHNEFLVVDAKMPYQGGPTPF